MKAIGSAIWSVPRAIGRGIRRVFSLVEDEDVRAVYGDNPNGLSDEQRLAAHGMASSIINSGSASG